MLIRQANLVNDFAKGPTDAYTVLAALHFQLSDTGLRGQLDQLTNFIDCHNRIA
jgi:hypothetical protein